MKNNALLKVGIVSAGGAGLGHIRYFNSLPDVEVTTVFDPKPENLERALDGGHWRTEKMFPHWTHYKFSTVNRVEGMLDSDLDIISVCSPDTTHVDYCVAALEAGKHVMCEKPMAPTFKDCMRIVAAVEKTGLGFAVMHQMRFIPLYQKAKAAIQAGEIGDIFYLEGDYIHNLRERGRKFDNWRYNEQLSHTPLMGGGCHFVDLFRWLTGDEMEEVQSYANNIAIPQYPCADCTVSVFRSRRGIISKIMASFGAELPHTHFLRVFGSMGTIWDNYLYDERGVRKVLHKPLLRQQDIIPRNYAFPLRALTQLARTALGTRDRTYVEINETLRGLLHITPHAFPLDTHEHTLASVRLTADFIRAIRTGQTSSVNAREGAMTVAASEAGTRAFLERRAVRISEVVEGML